MMKVWYLAHDGFAVELGERVLIFDYYKTDPVGGGFAQGVVDPEALRGKEVVAFVSHRHNDHFNRAIFAWRTVLPDIRYLLSSDIRAKGEEALFLRPGETQQVTTWLRVKTLRSTDEGVAFLCETPDGVIYHAGDLNWWHWNGETAAFNEQMRKDYCGQIDLLRGEKIDLAFLPLDPRQEDQYAWGYDYFMRTVGARQSVPMHLWENFACIDRLRKDACSEPYREQICGYSRRGEQVL